MTLGFSLDNDPRKCQFGDALLSGHRMNTAINGQISSGKGDGPRESDIDGEKTITATLQCCENLLKLFAEHKFWLQGKITIPDSKIESQTDITCYLKCRFTSHMQKQEIYDSQIFSD